MKKLMNQKIFDEFYRSHVCRIFDDEGNMFMMVNEIEHVFGVKIFGEEKLESGFLKTISIGKFKKFVNNNLDIDKNDVHLILHKITRTERNIGVPIVTSNGTHCKLAIDAFSDIFEYLSSGLRLFESPDFNKSELKDIYKWFKEELDIYGGKDSGKGKNEKNRFFVEIWKIEEMIEKMRNKFGNLKKSHEKVLIDPKKLKNKDRYNKNETVRIVSSISNDVLNINDEVVYSRFLYFSKLYRTSFMTPTLIYRIYEYCAKIGFISGDDDCRDFICKQGVCRQQLIRGFSCYCNMLIDTNLEQTRKSEERFYSKDDFETLSSDYVEANHIKFLDIFKYCLVAENGEKFYDNDTCLLKTLDLSLVNLNFEDTAIAWTIYQEEYSEMKRVFYLNKDETMILVKDNMQMFKEQMLKIAKYSYDSSKKSIIKWSDISDEFMDFSNDLIEKILMKLLKNHKKATKSGIPTDVVAKLKKKCRFFRFFYRKCAQNMSSLTDFTKNCAQKKERKCILRIMAKSRVESQSSWHCFLDELLEFVQVHSDVTRGTDILIETIERIQLGQFNNYSFPEIEISLMSADENLAFLKKLIMFVPDIQFTQCYIKLPLKMGFDCVRVQAPNREWVYHHIQAKFMIFQCTACDVDLNLENQELPKRESILTSWKFELIMAMKSIPQGYISTEIIDGLIRKCMNCTTLKYSRDADCRLALNKIHNKRFNDLISMEELIKDVSLKNRDSNFSGSDVTQFSKNAKFQNPQDGKNIAIWKAKYIFMMTWIEHFMKDEEKLKYDIKNGFTACLPYLTIENHSDWVNWMTKNFLKASNRLFEMSKFEKCVEIWKKSEKKNHRFKETDLVEKHHWDTQKYDKIKKISGKSMTEEIGEMLREDQLFKEKMKKKNEEILEFLLNQAKLNSIVFIESISAEEFKPIQDLKKLIKEQFVDFLEDEDNDYFDRVFEDSEFLEIFCEKFKNLLEFRMNKNGNREFKRSDYVEVPKSPKSLDKHNQKSFWHGLCAPKMGKNMDMVKQISKQARKNEKKVEPVIVDSSKKPKRTTEKKEKKEKTVVSIQIEKQYVEVCEFCEENKTELMRKTRKIDELERQNGEMAKNMEDLQGVIGNLKGQLTETRTKYRTEAKILKKDYDKSEERIRQLQNEIEQYRKETREERENMCVQEQKEARKMEHEMIKMKKEIENLKFLNNTMGKQLNQKTAENDCLMTQLEIEKEKNEESVEQKKTGPSNTNDVLTSFGASLSNLCRSHLKN